MNLAELRHQYHQKLCEQILGLRSGVLNIADCGSRNETSQEMLTLLVEGRRLRDISDLPLDLAV